MTADDLIEDDDFDGLPDDPEQRLAALIRKVRPRFAKYIESIDEREMGDHSILVAYHDFQSSVSALAAGWDIEYSGSFAPEPLSRYHMGDAREFMASLTSFVSKQRAVAEQKTRSNLAQINEKKKAEMREKVSELRKNINESGLNRRQKERLHKLLDDFERELSKPKPDLRILAGAMFIVGMAADFDGASSFIEKNSDWLAHSLVEAQAEWKDEDSSPPRQITYQPNPSEAPREQEPEG
jgi:hypothetical protein